MSFFLDVTIFYYRQRFSIREVAVGKP